MCAQLEGFTVFVFPLFHFPQKECILPKGACRSTFLVLFSGLFWRERTFFAPSTKPYYFWGGAKRNWLGPADQRNPCTFSETLLFLGWCEAKLARASGPTKLLIPTLVSSILNQICFLLKGAWCLTSTALSISFQFL